MLPGHLIHEYWLEVEQQLTARYPDRAAVQRGIARYRDALASKGVDEMIYHQNPEEVAQAIAVSFLRD